MTDAFVNYVFAGNRAFVLERALALGLHFKKVFAVRGSYLERYCLDNGVAYEVIRDKRSLIDELSLIDFDCFVSNGVPYILPISELKRSGRKVFINIHPSLLPDLRGRHPVSGALLLGRDAGVTCHYMDDGIDTGEIISQIRIPYTEDLDSSLLYQLSFRAEADVFENAWRCGFVAQGRRVVDITPVYYSRSETDLKIMPERDSAAEACRRVRAYNALSIPASLEIDGRSHPVRCAESIENPYVLGLASGRSVGEVVLRARLPEGGFLALVKMREGVLYAKFHVDS